MGPLEGALVSGFAGLSVRKHVPWQGFFWGFFCTKKFRGHSDQSGGAPALWPGPGPVSGRVVFFFSLDFMRRLDPSGGAPALWSHAVAGLWGGGVFLGLRGCDRGFLEPES